MQKNSCLETIELDVYEKGVKIPRHNGLVSVVGAHCSGDAAKVLRMLCKGLSKTQHLDMASDHEMKRLAAEKEYGSALDAASQRTFGRPFLVTDYQVSGIGSDKFPEADKTLLRSLVRRMRVHRAAICAHKHSAKYYFR